MDWILKTLIGTAVLPFLPSINYWILEGNKPLWG